MIEALWATGRSAQTCSALRIMLWMLCGLTFVLTPALAWAEWTKVTRSSRGTYYLDLQSVRDTSAGRMAFQLLDLYAPDRDGYLSYTFLYEYECTRGRYRFMRSEYFPGRMADGIGYSESEPSKYFVTPKATTVDARIMRRVCAAVLN
jgi:hypothetical protein